MVLGQKWPFLQLLFFSAKQARKMSFSIFYIGKTPFMAIKIRKSKSRKIAIFPKGLTHGFGPKMAIFSTSLIQATQTRKMSFTIFQNKKTPFQAIKTTSLESQKIDIFPFFHFFFFHFLVIKWPFFQLFFFRQYRQGKCLLRYSTSKKRLFRL